MYRPLLAITMGDPAGVGPETIAAAWADLRLHADCRAVVVGHPELMQRATKLVGHPIEVVETAAIDDAVCSPQVMPCLRACSDDALRADASTISAAGGQASYDALISAAELALAGKVDAIVTAPLNKAALWEAGHQYPGHTELLAEVCGADEFAMMLYLPPGDQVRGRIGLGVVHVTLHTSLRSVPDRLTQSGIVAKAHLAQNFFSNMLGDLSAENPPRIGVCALNPHAGEEGLFGDEEIRLIRPAVREAVADGLLVEGPLAADTLFPRAVRGDFDGVVAMFHDQGHIALKLLGMHQAVNVTLGLPIIRTSVAHGTAFDLAWTGRADYGGMIEAVRVAAQMTRNQRLQSNPTKAASPAR